MNRFFVVALLAFSATAVADMVDGYSIKNIYVRESLTDIELTANFTAVPNCAVKNVLRIKTGQFQNSQAMISAALAAHMAGKAVGGWIGECDSNGFPIIYSIKVN